MKKLPRPTYSAKSAYLTCISTVVQDALNVRLSSATDAVVSASIEFDSAAKVQRLHGILPNNLSGLLVTKRDLINVYIERMVRKGSPGRNIYNKLLNSPLNKRCPLCGHREVSTLDHHLDKDTFPLLSVAPLNLVPACKDCNYIKRSFFPTSSDDETIHPYYDETDDDVWLKATVIETLPAGIEFSVIQPNSWQPTKFNRVKNHFELFELNSLYESNAATELSNIQYEKTNLFRNSGKQALAESLMESQISREQIALNSWQSAFYRALATNSWYLTGNAFY
jgi:hypothetical protein